jgi:hypothetical protein
MNLTLQRNGETVLAISTRVPTQDRRKAFNCADESLDFVTQVNSDYPRLEVTHLTSNNSVPKQFLRNSCLIKHFHCFDNLPRYKRQNLFILTILFPFCKYH